MSFKWARHEGAFRLFQFEKDCRPSHRGGGGAHIPIDSSLHTFLARRNRGRSFFRAEGFSFSWDTLWIAKSEEESSTELLVSSPSQSSCPVILD